MTDPQQLLDALPAAQRELLRDAPAGDDRAARPMAATDVVRERPQGGDR
ncbi:hypothetical protein ACFVFQ_31510 [Streptomyces sp. NPDC057743]